MSKTTFAKGSKKPFHTLRNTFYMLKYILRYTPEYLAVVLVEVLANVIWNLLSSVLFVKYLFDALEKKSDFREILLVACSLILYKLVFEFGNKWVNNVYYPKAQLRLHEGMQKKLYMKAKSLDLSCYDDPAFYNDYIWSIRESDARIIKLVIDIKGFFNSVLTTLGMLLVFIKIDWIIIATALFSTVIGLFVKVRSNKLNYEKSVEINPITRKLEYIKRVFYLSDYSKELRLGNISQILKIEYDKATDEKIKHIKQYAPHILKLSLLSQWLTSCLFDILVTAYLIFKYASYSNFSLGDFSASINVTWKIFVQINKITNYVACFNEHSIYVDKFRNFIEYDPKIISGTQVAQPLELLELKNVSFSYDIDNVILNNITLSIHRGEKVAIVGHNGAGKTTFIKLLMRLYDVSEGNILYNGKDIREYEINSYRSHFGAVFQDCKLFAATIGENVKGGEYLEEDEDCVIAALKTATFNKIDSLPNGTKTMLTKEFDENGINLSGGEIQKISIARAFSNSHDLIIMDEPSSALDPIAEYELNKSVCESYEKKTMIFISHRLSTTCMVDKIYMFANGTIIEQGSHEELMKLNGEYSKMFLAQAKKYTSL